MMKTKNTIAAEPEPVYGRGGTVQGYLMQCFVPKKDKSFFLDLAKVRGWELPDIQADLSRSVRGEKSQKAVTTKPAKRLSGLEKAIQEIERGEVFSATSVDDMFEQILGKGWRTK